MSLPETFSSFFTLLSILSHYFQRLCIIFQLCHDFIVRFYNTFQSNLSIFLSSLNFFWVVDDITVLKSAFLKTKLLRTSSNQLINHKIPSYCLAHQKDFFFNFYENLLLEFKMSINRLVSKEPFIRSSSFGFFI